MLIIAEKMNGLSFRQLMDVYVEGCLERGQELYPEETAARQIALGEQEFYHYLTQVFFRTSGAVYALWSAEEKYVSALRLEPFQDGLLLEALETAPKERKKGYAVQLIRAVQAWLAERGHIKVYSHVHKRNIPSLRIHEKCGFHQILEHAVCIDGSVNHYCCTLCYEG